MAKKLFAKIAMVVLNLLLPFLSIGFGAEAWRIMRGISPVAPRWSAFLLGVVVFIPLWFVGRLMMPRVIGYLTTLEHELTHILVGLLFLIRPLSIRVTETKGGEVVLTGSNLWITLAPYFLPTISFVVLPFAWLASAKAERTLLAVTGASVVYHLLSTWSEVGVVQSDFRKAGILQSLLLLPVANLICYGVILAFVAQGLQGVVSFSRGGALRTLLTIMEVLHIN